VHFLPSIKKNSEDSILNNYHIWKIFELDYYLIITTQASIILYQRNIIYIYI